MINLLFVDNVPHKYNCDQYKMKIANVDSKQKALSLIEEINFDAIFVNVQFNDHFLEDIRKIKPNIPLYLVNDENNGTGLEYAGLIDGYYKTPSLQANFKKILNKVHLRCVCG